MSKLTMTVKDRELTFYFDNAAWLEVEEAFGSMEKLWDKVEADETPMKLQLQLAAITANAGERKEGREPDITFEWMRDNLAPKQARLANTMAKLAVAAGLNRENVDDEDEGVVDLTAKELFKKKASPSTPENA